MQLQVVNSPFNQKQVDILNEFLPTLTEQQKLWLSGYLAATQINTGAVTVPAAPISKEVTILYGSQSGNSQSLSEKYVKLLQEKGYQVSISSMSDFKTNSLKKIKNLLVVVSTYGEGEPPDNALSFHEFLHGKRAPKLNDLRYSILSLGDTSYEFFCQTGKEFDVRFKELGATQLYERVDCDLDYEDKAALWFKEVVQALEKANGGESTAPTATPAAPAVKEAVVYSRTNPFKAEVLENLNLNGRGSKKETRHLEISLEGSGLTYEPGDTLGIYPENDPALVELLLTETKWNAEEQVVINKNGDTLPLKEALITHFEITAITKPVLKHVAELTGNETLKGLLEPANKEKLKAYIEGRDLLDLIRDYGPFDVPVKDFVAGLRKMAARLYSISSSIAANPEEVHLTIGAVRYEAHGRERHGVCSVHCADRIQAGDTLSIYLQPNKHFNLPENPETSIIMVGPGTGVAPFRSFMQEREETNVSGKSWMFYGDQHFVTDFLYQTEWQKWLEKGVLTKMDVAFSRDTDEKVYVQHRMLEQSKELYEWLQNGAHFYVCGDKKHMAQDVHNTLLTILEQEGGMSSEQAEAYLADMKKQKRYQRDVY